MPLGGLLGGVLGKYLGVRPALWVAAVGGVLTFLPVFFSPLRTMRELPTGHGEEPARASAAVEA
jgi:predicted MFS family arabinose efflux permease